MQKIGRDVAVGVVASLVTAAILALGARVLGSPTVLYSEGVLLSALAFAFGSMVVASFIGQLPEWQRASMVVGIVGFVALGYAVIVGLILEIWDVEPPAATWG